LNSGSLHLRPLGYEADALRAARRLLGKHLWDIGLFGNIDTSRVSFRELQERGYVRYEDLPLETKDGRHVEVEFVSNVYRVNERMIIQCNIRDITARKRAEEEMRQANEAVRRELESIARSPSSGNCRGLGFSAPSAG